MEPRLKWKDIRAIVMERDGNMCIYCGLKEELTIDHKIAKAKGGKNNIDNLQTLCHTCNQRKRTSKNAKIKRSVRMGLHPARLKEVIENEKRIESLKTTPQERG